MVLNAWIRVSAVENSSNGRRLTIGVEKFRSGMCLTRCSMRVKKNSALTRFKDRMRSLVTLGRAVSIAGIVQTDHWR